MQIIALLALAALIWLIWQLIKAKRFTRFKQHIDDELKDKVIARIMEELSASRSITLPNNASHQQATIYYWCEYKSRILHAALQRDIITEQWLIESGNLQNAQHLFFIERMYLPQA